jgi:hypothetical protein
MAGTILSGPTGLFDAYTRDQASLRSMIGLAMYGGEKGPGDTDLLIRKKVVTAEKFLMKEPDFTVDANTTAAETFAVCELIARGVTFPAGFMRVLTIDFYVAGNAADETGWARHTALVSGGSTPIVRVVTVPASTPVQVGGNTLSGVAGAGLAATPAVTVTAGASTVTVSVVSAEAENLNFHVRIHVGKLIPLRIPGS